MSGRYCRVVPLDVAVHGHDLVRCLGTAAANDGRWTYLPYGPFDTPDAFLEWLTDVAGAADPLFHAITDVQERATGVAAYMRIDTAHGVIEAGHLNFSPLLQRTAAATEAMYLMVRRAFDELGYRRFEWKCDSLNEPSRRAAVRLGFTYEGLFRNAVVYKQRNRDTSWYSMTDAEWPGRKAAFDAWLAPDNFDTNGQQQHALASFMTHGTDAIRRV
jgi:RimJ/RimL family protein N-acetyltransferase